MKILQFALLFLLWVNHMITQQPSDNVYISTLESLQKRVTPQWYSDAKLGIFIHWGLYSRFL